MDKTILLITISVVEGVILWKCILPMLREHYKCTPQEHMWAMDVDLQIMKRMMGIESDDCKWHKVRTWMPRYCTHCGKLMLWRPFYVYAHINRNAFPTYYVQVHRFCKLCYCTERLIGDTTCQ